MNLNDMDLYGHMNRKNYEMPARRNVNKPSSRVSKPAARDLEPITAIWTTRDGQRMRVCDMGDTHLNNAIKMLERNCRTKALETLKRERLYRDSAQCAICGEINGHTVQCPEY